MPPAKAPTLQKSFPFDVFALYLLVFRLCVPTNLYLSDNTNIFWVAFTRAESQELSLSRGNIRPRCCFLPFCRSMNTWPKKIWAGFNFGNSFLHWFNTVEHFSAAPIWMFHEPLASFLILQVYFAVGFCTSLHVRCDKSSLTAHYFKAIFSF